MDERDEQDGLVESQGVNAGPPVDAYDPAADSTEGPDAQEPPDRPSVPGITSDEMAGLPGHVPGYPGQERSVETS